MDDLLDDDLELFKSDRKDDGLKLEPSKEKETGGSGVKSGGLFDEFSLDEPEEQSASVNGHKGMSCKLCEREGPTPYCVLCNSCFVSSRPLVVERPAIGVCSVSCVRESVVLPIVYCVIAVL